jgi:peroxiredoxin
MIDQPAPDFTLPAIHQEGAISLADYRGRSHLLLAIFVGLYCPFCRRNIVQLGGAREKLRPLGVETLGVVATELDNARLYFKYRPARVPLVADSELVTHRAYALPHVEVNEQLEKAISAMRFNPSGELPEPLPMAEVGTVLDQKDGYVRTEADNRDIERQWPQLKGQFLIDREGIVRWANIECDKDGLAGIGKFPSDEELLAAARAVT